MTNNTASQTEKSQLNKLVSSNKFDNFIIGIILLNAAVLGLMASPRMVDFFDYLFFDDFLVKVDYICLGIFVVEMILKLSAWRTSFFNSRWNNFDLFIVLVSFVPSGESLLILRTFRVFRVLRLISRMPSLRRVVSSLGRALPHVASTAILLAIIFYVFAVMAVSLFGRDLVEFGSFGSALFVLFQIMTLDDWSETAELVMAFTPEAWVFFVSFIVLSVFTALNLFVSVIVDAVNQGDLLDKDSETDSTLTDELDERLGAIEQALLGDKSALEARARKLGKQDQSNKTEE